MNKCVLLSKYGKSFICRDKNISKFYRQCLKTICVKFIYSHCCLCSQNNNVNECHKIIIAFTTSIQNNLKYVKTLSMYSISIYQKTIKI